jgi:hypothetical protein
MIWQSRFIFSLIFGLFAWSPLAGAQQPPKVPIVAILSDEIRLQEMSFEPFAQGLRDLGYIEGPEHRLRAWVCRPRNRGSS